ncbi:hypothetical protein PVOR_09859 [Paenibacillus vortex V453]|uniref:Uncharacterized protein n=1 Tax=Paenibacillus vortex V453 TaxID=715225 RepID=A0A2R9SXT6_9BACL|nr:hypothetical protein [Paenibacillus vortex]EFU42161.1 hypothetical protein PVOR_09859 [Paenibacillus vortex V453]
MNNQTSVYRPTFTKVDFFIIFGTAVFPPVFLAVGLLQVVASHRFSYRKGSNYSLLSTLLVMTFLWIFIYAYFVSFAGLESSIRTKETQSLMLIVAMFCLPLIVTFQVMSMRANTYFKGLETSYKELLLNQDHDEIAEIARQVNRKPEQATEDIMFLMQENTLPSGTIEDGIIYWDGENDEEEEEEEEEQEQEDDESNNDDDTLEVETDSSQKAEQEAAAESSLIRSIPSKLPKSTQCVGCGSKVILQPEESKECEYCGSWLNYM